MQAGNGNALNPILRKLGAIATLTEEDGNRLRALPFYARTLPADHDIAREDERPTQCCIILDGWACRSKFAGDGTKQIVALHLPGDMPDLQSLYVPVMDHTITTITPVTAAMVSQQDIRDLISRAPQLAAVLWRYTLIETAITREWVVNMSVRSAKERIAHLLCETFARLYSLGLSQVLDQTPMFPWPLTQAQLGEVTGLSSVHVNRSLQGLRADGLIRMSHKWVAIPDRKKLEAFAGFKVGYLSLRQAGGESVAA